ncbi:hypothetical protein [Virgibacillus sp. YIM 98842]|uniref:hypothetical protein n=1 Tax=Virgibacillus sp. YIM 98842 TaxID=2663533 RepID=UPI0013DC8641|nr:hypothetical protein [Virgibacillus sp. YIM 98842]
MKKVLIYTLIFLFLFSVYKDLNVGSLENNINSPSNSVSISDYNAVYAKVQHGDTILSIVENINGENLNVMDMDRVLEDFKLLNPNVNPYELKAGHYYYFPLY